MLQRPPQSAIHSLVHDSICNPLWYVVCDSLYSLKIVEVPECVWPQQHNPVLDNCALAFCFCGPTLILMAISVDWGVCNFESSHRCIKLCKKLSAACPTWSFLFYYNLQSLTPNQK